MAEYQDLLDAIARVRGATGDPAAWQAGLSGADIAIASTPISSPQAISEVMAKVIAAHRDVFGRGPLGGPPPVSQGASADAVHRAESALAQQHSSAAQVDLQVVRAVLDAHTTESGGRAQLDRVQAEIAAALLARTGLDTPAGAREFQRFLIGELREIQSVLDSASLDARSRADLAAALGVLYASATPSDSVAESVPAQRVSVPALDAPRVDVPADVGPPPDAASGWPAPMEPPAAAPAMMPAAPSPAPAAATPPAIPTPATPAPTPPAPWGGMPGATPLGAGMPLGAGGFPTLSGSDFGGLGSGFGPGVGSGFDPGSDPLDSDRLELGRQHHRTFEHRDGLDIADPATDEPPDSADDADRASVAGRDAAVELPDGDNVVAASPQVAAAISAAIAGAPIPDAFRQQGIVLPPPGVTVADELKPADVVCGDIGVLADRHALALGHGKALLDGQIQPISAVTGPGFLGWQHPPRPEPTSTPPGAPAPNRPAQTAPS